MRILIRVLAASFFFLPLFCSHLRLLRRRLLSLRMCSGGFPPPDGYFRRLGGSPPHHGELASRYLSVVDVPGGVVGGVGGVEDSTRLRGSTRKRQSQ